MEGTHLVMNINILEFHVTCVHDNVIFDRSDKDILFHSGQGSIVCIVDIHQQKLAIHPSNSSLYIIVTKVELHVTNECIILLQLSSNYAPNLLIMTST